MHTLSRMLLTRPPLSEKQLAANRANAQKSCGPKSPGGKYNSSRNAITHGFLATSVLLPGESRQRFLDLIASFVTEFEPSTTNEHHLVETLAHSRWRLLRLWTLEAAAIAHEQNRQTESTTEENAPTQTMLAVRSLAQQHPQGHANMSRDEVRLDRQYHRALDSLLRIREEKRAGSRQETENTEVNA